jgi:putative molybdopterin biosynthesis protein
MNRKRNVYLKMKTLAEARDIQFTRFHGLSQNSSETMPTIDALSRVLAGPVFAQISSPNFHAAAMDGVAVKAKDTFGVNESRPRNLRIGKDAFHVNTGHVMPGNTDAVIMVEHIQVLDADQIRIEAPAFPWQNVRKTGEDIVATELIFPRYHKINPYSLGALLSAGLFEISVLKKPKLLIIPTGSELVDWQRIAEAGALKPGQVIETNSHTLGKMAEACGACYVRNERIMDDEDKIAQIVQNGLEEDFDMVLILGGSSAGSHDFARPAIETSGEILVHGVTIMPGKPIIIGKAKEKPVFGIPGYPVSAIIAFEQFVRPLILKMLGQPDEPRPTISVEPTRKIPSKLGTEEFIRVKLGQVDDRYVATPLSRGSGNIKTLTEADGIIRVPNAVEGFRENEPVACELLKPLCVVKNTVVIVGSHDNTLDLLADQIRSGHADIALSSSHVGSMGGLMAIKRGMCHLAGAHLLNTEDGSYNVSYIQKYLPDTPVCLINLVLRDQGFIVAKHNPRGIKGIEDLGRNDVRFINRQPGSGTRILLDHRLSETGLTPADINGYENEEFTHMSVAVCVLSGAADVGLGIYAAAKALDLEFIPVVTEQYDLVVPKKYLHTRNIGILLETIRTTDFKDRVMSLGGYHTEKTGDMIWESSASSF